VVQIVKPYTNELADAVHTRTQSAWVDNPRQIVHSDRTQAPQGIDLQNPGPDVRNLL
jgi:hypothetical protein